MVTHTSSRVNHARPLRLLDVTSGGRDRLRCRTQRVTYVRASHLLSINIAHAPLNRGEVNGEPDLDVHS